MIDEREARWALDLAAARAAEAVGWVEPNPPVGCVILRPGGGGHGPAESRVIGVGIHEKFGQAHAEANALRDCAARGHDPAGATVYVTLEPCAKPGRNPPCAGALIAARVGRVVCARRDVNPLKRGGAEVLAAAGIACEFTAVSPAASHLADAFVTNVTEARAYVIAKWAASIDGKVATARAESQWISGEPARREVHELRARVDAVMVGIGTALADDPRLNAREVEVRRVARRLIIDPGLRLPPTARLFDDAHDAPVIVVGADVATEEQSARAELLRAAGATVWLMPVAAAERPARFDLRGVLARLWREHQAARVMVEGGPRLTGALLAADLIDEVRVYIGPLVVGDAAAPSAVLGSTCGRLADAPRYELAECAPCGNDVRAVWRRRHPT